MSLNEAQLVRIRVNGESHEVEAASIRGLLNALGHDSEFIAVAVNHTVIPRARWGEDLLRDGDDVEIVSPRQGG
ncbi:sulfur carrier protein ThiS [Camelimonas abortus]|uniref:Sulfur carrier protein ThiS n=1 Tax=Camelimonas abortus TaxID=1017184 RepID=A0ABV7LH43_9HYPH